MPANDPNAHVTNLECPDAMRQRMEQAQSDHMAEPDDAQKAHQAQHAKVLYEGNQATLALIEAEWGPYAIGKPRKTKWKSSELLAEQGYVGIYRRA